MKLPIGLLVLLAAGCAPSPESIRADLGPEASPPLTGQAFEVRCHASTAVGCQALANLLEAKYPVMEAFLRLPNRPPEQRMVIEVASERAAMKAAAEKLDVSPDTVGVTKPFASYVLCKSCALQEPNADEQATALIEGLQAVSLARIGNWSLQPAWIRQGSAMVFAEEELHAPRPPNRIAALKKLVDAGRLPTPDLIIHGDLKDYPIGQRNDLYWALYRFLRTQPYRARFDDFIERAQTAPPKNYGRNLAVNFADTFGPMDALGAAFKAYVSSLAT